MTQVRWELLSAVHAALPVSMHSEWTVKVLEAGKHVSPIAPRRSQVTV
ncbi:MAG TPA: hypothetical protein VK204_12340 [Nocardioidaceae bacterium]|jgi:predicted dehydrogenase|nr:hypothetical protein [Nocardioidaceae bacterium]